LPQDATGVFKDSYLLDFLDLPERQSEADLQSGLLRKFVPGVSLLTPPVAGRYGIGFGVFLLLDGIGSMLWAGAWLGTGRYFGDLLKHDATLLELASHFSGVLLILPAVGFVIQRVYRRRSVLKTLTASRLEPEELKRKLELGEPVFIVDLRHPLELIPDPFTLPGAHYFSPEELTSRHHDIPRDREIVLYCTCPSEETAARTALMLHQLGIERVRPLRGGFDEWRRLGYPLEPIAPAIPYVQAA
jgi:rhodanese-related sulfurtransferase